jgi:hypothetical protein
VAGILVRSVPKWFFVTSEISVSASSLVEYHCDESSARAIWGSGVAGWQDEMVRIASSPEDTPQGAVFVANHSGEDPPKAGCSPELFVDKVKHLDGPRVNWT